jgi:hypothetical protein
MTPVRGTATGRLPGTNVGITPAATRDPRVTDLEARMGIGVSIFLIALGAILTFATDVSVSGLDLDVVGIVLMLVGALGLIMTLLIWGPRRRVAAVDPVDRVDRVDRVAPPREVVQERRVYRDEPPL